MAKKKKEIKIVGKVQSTPDPERKGCPFKFKTKDGMEHDGLNVELFVKGQKEHERYRIACCWDSRELADGYVYDPEKNEWVIDEGVRLHQGQWVEVTPREVKEKRKVKTKGGIRDYINLWIDGSFRVKRMAPRPSAVPKKTKGKAKPRRPRG